MTESGDARIENPWARLACACPDPKGNSQGKPFKPDKHNYVIMIMKETKRAIKARARREAPVKEKLCIVQGRSNEKETGPAEVRRMWKKKLKVSHAKQDKPCVARPFPSWRSGARCKPPSGFESEPRKLLKISHFPIIKFTALDWS